MASNGRYQEAWINNQAFSAAHPSLLLQHISEGELQLSQQTQPKLVGGLYLVNNYRQKREITLEFAIKEPYDYVKRGEAFQAACAWAASGGWLELSSHPGQMIYVIPSKMPALGRLREWNEDLALVLTAFYWPYWMDKIGTEKTSSNVTGVGYNFPILGTSNSYLELEATPKTEALTSVNILSNGQVMDIMPASGVCPAGRKLSMYYDEQHRLQITAGLTHILRYRSGVDDIVLAPGGTRYVSVSFNTACDVTLRTRGEWV